MRRIKENEKCEAGIEEVRERQVQVGSVQCGEREREEQAGKRGGAGRRQAEERGRCAEKEGAERGR